MEHFDRFDCFGCLWPKCLMQPQRQLFAPVQFHQNIHQAIDQINHSAKMKKWTGKLYQVQKGKQEKRKYQPGAGSVDILGWPVMPCLANEYGVTPFVIRGYDLFSHPQQPEK